MSRRNKLLKFAELLTFPNVYENFDPKHPELAGVNGLPIELKGLWAKQHFGNTNPITLELACGRGEYTLDLARRFPDRNFIGVDVKGARIWKGAKIALDEGLHHAAFVRTHIEQIALFFTPGEIDEIWITFPDPFLEGGNLNRRLTAANFFPSYRRIIKPGGLMHLKTDSPELYEFTLETLNNESGAKILYHDNDIYAKPLVLPELETKTFYERIHLSEGKTIKYIQFTL